MEFISRSHAMKSTGLSYIGGINTSSKIMKNLKKKNTDTYIIYLAPSTLSGYNVCPMASTGCIAACLHSSGRSKIDIKGIINNARIKKTKMFFEDRQFFNDWVIAEITAHKRNSLAKGHEFSVRINGTSDINPELISQNNSNLFQLFPDTIFYDYTKVLNRNKLLSKYENYDLTYSYNGENWADCEIALSTGMRVAVVFEKQPDYYMGIQVIDGDFSDVRYLDEKDVIVGLTQKKVKVKIDISKQNFIISKDNPDCSY